MKADPSPPSARGASRRAARALRGLVTGTLAVALGSCTLVNGGGSDRPAPPSGDRPEAAPPPEAVRRSFEGQMSVQGTTLPVVLSLVIRGEEVEDALLSVPELSMEAQGDGRLQEGRMDLQLRYGQDGCDGDARIRGEVEPGGQLFEGVLEARDCTGAEEGALTLRLRPGGGPLDGSADPVVESTRPGV